MASNDPFWSALGDEIIDVAKRYHRADLNMSVAERLKHMDAAFRDIIKRVKARDYKSAIAYIKSRATQDRHMRAIQTATKRDLTKMFMECLADGPRRTFHVFPESSFSAGTNLLNESDIDFNCAIEHLDATALKVITRALEQRGYKFVEVRAPNEPDNVHHVFNRFVSVADSSPIELEIKVRELHPYFGHQHKMHQYIDTKLSAPAKAVITLIKFHMKALSATQYGAFKMLYYESGLHGARVPRLLYRLV